MVILRTFAAAVVLLGCGLGLAEETKAPAAPAFELADVHVSPHSNNSFLRGGMLRGQQYIVRQATMVDLIAIAYGVENDNVLGGPPWLDTDRYDILAKAPRGTSPEDAKLMLRALLGERFRLVVRSDTKPLPSYVLRVSRDGLKIKEADSGEPRNLEEHHTPTNLPPGTPAYYSIICRNMPMKNFANILHDFATAYLPKPVVDATGLANGYDFELKWTWRPTPDGLTIFEAVKKQLGLSLELENYSTPVMVVETALEKPTPNAPGVGKDLPAPPPPEFDVAVLKPSSPDSNGIQGRINGGQVKLTGATVQWLIAWAWNLNPNDKDAIVGAPKWLNEVKYDILAKVAPEPQAKAKDAPQIDFDELQEMMRKLVTERFQMTAHMEDRVTDAYTLVAVNPKMKKADPLTRTGCKEGPGPDGKDPRITNPILGRLITCKNMSMAQLGDELRNLAGGYIYAPVVDATGLQGEYDFTLSFSSIGQLRSAPSPGSADSPNQAGASDPNGGLSLFDAVRQQLGLKLEKVRRPEPALVIDQIADKPIDN